MIILTMTYERRPSGGGSIKMHIERFFYDDNVSAKLIENKVTEFLKEHKNDYSCAFKSIKRI